MKIQLGEVVQGQISTLEIFQAPGGEQRGLVLVLPGGGYHHLAPHEAEPVARKFVELGFHAAVCMYRVTPVTYPVPLEDARGAVRYIREHAAELLVKPDKIALLGFSAGGHLAAMTAHMPGAAVNRPDATILCYPVLSSVTGGERAHCGSYHNLFGNKLAPEEYRDFCWAGKVDGNTPPSFLWHTMEDPTVPVEESLEYAMALQKAHVPYALHIFTHGGHGLGIGNRPNCEGKFPEIDAWPELCADWLRTMGW